MVLDDAVVQFITGTEPLYIHLAVANSMGKPFSIRGFGVKVLQDEDLLHIYILKAQASKVLTCLNSGNSMVACLFTDGFSNESYQVKGSFIDIKATVEEDRGLLTYYRNTSLKLFPKLHANFPLSPALCDVISLKAKEIFIQTPGPYAGNKYDRRGSRYDT